MRPLRLMNTNTFQWASAVAGTFAIVVTLLFGFIYWKIDDYLVMRSDHLVSTQLQYFAGLPPERQVNAIEDHIGEDARGVQFTALFDAQGRRMVGNLERLPERLAIDAPVQGAKLVRIDQRDRGEQLVRVAARRLPSGAVLVIGRNVDEAREISGLVGQALAFSLLSAAGLCLVTAVWLSRRAEKRVEEVNQRVRRIVAGDLRERLPHDGSDDPFSRLAGIVNRMLDEMEAMITALAGVGNDIAHDLRTPLTRARLALERGRTHATTLEQLQQVADKAISGIDQSLAIVTALLRLAEIENGRRSAAFGEVQLGEILRQVCDVYEPIAEDKRIALTVRIAGECGVAGDRDLLFEAVANLVDNGIKFTPEGGTVDVALLRADGETILRVTDSGPGVAEQEREAVLRRFYRSDKIRSTPGVGLGLNLVAAIAKLHGFRLVIHPGPGGKVDIVSRDA